MLRYKKTTAKLDWEAPKFKPANNEEKQIETNDNIEEDKTT